VEVAARPRAAGDATTGAAATGAAARDAATAPDPGHGRAFRLPSFARASSPS
jgi:hypothetical protein